MAAPSVRIVADIGNSRMKWGGLGPDGRIARRIALEIADPASWRAAIHEWRLDANTRWAVGSVNPPAASTLEEMLANLGMCSVSWYRSAATVPVPCLLPDPSRAGADRALAALAAIAVAPRPGPGLVISCGTALTIERITPDGRWEGGVIAPGLGLSARALNRNTAQLPFTLPDEEPPSWGNTTESSLSAGIFWGTVGSVRELIRRQDGPSTPGRWHLWTGGDAALLAPRVDGEEGEGRVVPDLVLAGLAFSAFDVPMELILA